MEAFRLVYIKKLTLVINDCPTRTLKDFEFSKTFGFSITNMEYH